MRETFYLKFTENDNAETYDIDEPFGFDAAEFNTLQEDKKFSRDVLYSMGEIDFEFTDRRNHQLEKLLFFADKYGFESEVVLGILADGHSIELELDFSDSTTDGLTYFKCGLIQDSKLQIIKRRYDVKVNLLSNEDLDGNPIEPLVPESILLKAKPIVQFSKWDGSEISGDFAGYGNDGVIIAPFTTLTAYEVDESQSPFIAYNPIADGGNQAYVQQIRREINLVEAKSNLTNLKVKIKGLNVSVATSGAFVNTTLNLNYGQSRETGQFTTITLYTSSSLNVNLVDASYEVIIPFIPNLGFMWINLNVFQPYSLPGGTPVSNSHIEVSSPDDALTVEAVSTAYNTTTPTFRLVDVMRYVVKSISGLDINAPRFEQQFYNQRLFNGNFLRQKTDQPFYITLKQIEDGLSEMNGNYEIQTDDKVFFGIYEDFYRDEEIAFFTQDQFDSFKKSYNPRYSISKFSFGYKSYQSQKENTEENTVDSVHGESEWLLRNRKVENHRDIKVEWIRDSFLIEKTRRDAIEESQSTATQDDDKLFAIDTYPTVPNSLWFNETSFLQHSYNSSNHQLIIKNDGSFSWISIGAAPNFNFHITSGQNIGVYMVVSVSTQTLVVVGGVPGQNFFNGEAITGYTYFINTSLLHGISWTNEGGLSTNNIANGNNFVNLKHSIKNNIINFHSSYLSTCNLYRNNLYLANTFYKNNPDAVISYNGLSVTEGENFLPTDPILTPVLYKDCIFLVSFAKFIQLQNDIRTKRGFVRFIDNQGIVRKMYVQDMAYSPMDEALKINKGEEKFEPVIINIVTNDNGTKTINNEYTMLMLKSESVGDKIRIMDNEDYLLYNPVFWNRISINGVIAATQNELNENIRLLN